MMIVTPIEQSSQQNFVSCGFGGGFVNMGNRSKRGEFCLGLSSIVGFTAGVGVRCSVDTDLLKHNR